MSNGRMTDSVPYGQHVSITCVNHPHLRWSSKNIGSRDEANGTLQLDRSLFYFSRDQPECACPASDLRLVEDMKDIEAKGA